MGSGSLKSGAEGSQPSGACSMVCLGAQGIAFPPCEGDTQTPATGENFNYKGKTFNPSLQ